MTTTGSLDAPALAGVLGGLSNALAGSIADLTHADQAVGDGDHGLAIQRGLRAASTALAGQAPGDDVGVVLDRFGLALLTSMGGASGAIYGTLFRRGGGAITGRTTLDADAYATFLESGLAGVRERGGAAVGDKTLVDALQPAAEAARQLASSPLPEAMERAAVAAAEGLERTRGMRATLGRARALGDRAVGHVDPGALSFTMLLQHWSRLVGELDPRP